MMSFKPELNRKISTAVSSGLIMAVAAGTLLMAAPASAQQPAKKAPAAAQVKKAAPATKSSEWVKLCEKQKGDRKGNVCLTHLEKFHPNTGQPLISAAIRKIDGQKGETVMVMVPLGRLLKYGLLLKVDENKPLKLQYSFCTSLGCVAETPATPEIISSFKKGKILIIGTKDINNKKIGFPVKLQGFSYTYAGPPIDRAVYTKARKEMFEDIRARQVELLKRAKAKIAEKKKATGGAAAPAPATAPAPAPAPKKLQ